MLGIFFTVRIMDVLPISLSNCEQWRSQEFDLGVYVISCVLPAFNKRKWWWWWWRFN